MLTRVLFLRSNRLRRKVEGRAGLSFFSLELTESTGYRRFPKTPESRVGRSVCPIIVATLQTFYRRRGIELCDKGLDVCVMLTY